MAAGLTVATTLSNGASELIRHGENGLVLEEDFRAAWDLLREPPTLESLGAAARETAERRTWSHHADEVIALYRQVAESVAA
jgi:glycosyltransferase involved in cell wall biosynthesis